MSLPITAICMKASVDMPAAEERENMAKSEELLEKVSGRKVVGYRGPLDLLPQLCHAADG